MGNSASTESRNSASTTEEPQNPPKETPSTAGFVVEKKPAAPPVVTTTDSSSSSSHNIPYRISVTAPAQEIPDEPDSATSDVPPETAESAAKTTNMAPPPPKAVPVSTGRSGWVSSTGSTSPWYGSLSSSASSHRRSDSVRGPYYRARGMSITKENEFEEDQQLTGQQRMSRRASTYRDSYTKGVPTIITWSQGGNNVYVTGTFNGWKHKIKLVKSTHDFSAVLELPPGTHRLKFIVDDEWKCSNDMEAATDPDGNLVNYLQVLDEDQEYMDDFGDAKTDQETISRSSTPTEEYTSEIPADFIHLASVVSAEDGANSKAVKDWEKQQPQPPSLPPHLDKILLNSQAVSEEDNSVLPEPNHVTLNHLYATSIKDNVMALSTTTRYRKKYVTTMYYRPVFPKN